MRTKKKVIAGVTLEMAQDASNVFATKYNELQTIEAKMNEEINVAKANYIDKITALQTALEEPQEVLQAYANEQKESWGKKKSLELLHCIIGFRTGTPKVDKDKKFTWEAIIELLKQSKSKALKSFLVTTTTLNKKAILAEKNEAVLGQLKEDYHIKIEQDETFYVQPKVEEVAEA